MRRSAEETGLFSTQSLNRRRLSAACADSTSDSFARMSLNEQLTMTSGANSFSQDSLYLTPFLTRIDESVHVEECSPVSVCVDLDSSLSRESPEKNDRLMSFNIPSAVPTHPPMITFSEDNRASLLGNTPSSSIPRRRVPAKATLPVSIILLLTICVCSSCYLLYVCPHSDNQFGVLYRMCSATRRKFGYYRTFDNMYSNARAQLSSKLSCVSSPPYFGSIIISIVIVFCACSPKTASGIFGIAFSLMELIHRTCVIVIMLLLLFTLIIR